MKKAHKKFFFFLAWNFKEQKYKNYLLWQLQNQ